MGKLGIIFFFLIGLLLLLLTILIENQFIVHSLCP
jgi:hypothetical protein